MKGERAERHQGNPEAKGPPKPKKVKAAKGKSDSQNGPENNTRKAKMALREQNPEKPNGPNKT
jgi:hypothetical protein